MGTACRFFLVRRPFQPKNQEERTECEIEQLSNCHPGINIPRSALEVDVKHQVKHSLINHINMWGNLSIFTVGSQRQPLILPRKHKVPRAVGDSLEGRKEVPGQCPRNREAVWATSPLCLVESHVQFEEASDFVICPTGVFGGKLTRQILPTSSLCRRANSLPHAVLGYKMLWSEMCVSCLPSHSVRFPQQR